MDLSDNDFENDSEKEENNMEIEYIMRLLNSGVISNETFNDIFGFLPVEQSYSNESTREIEVEEGEETDNRIDNDIDNDNTDCLLKNNNNILNDNIENTDKKVKKRKKKKKRCPVCRTKLGLISFKCSCGKSFCSLHRYAEEHSCSFDYKTPGRAKLLRDNPGAIAEKIRKI